MTVTAGPPDSGPGPGRHGVADCSTWSLNRPWLQFNRRSRDSCHRDFKLDRGPIQSAAPPAAAAQCRVQCRPGSHGPIVTRTPDSLANTKTVTGDLLGLGHRNSPELEPWPASAEADTCQLSSDKRVRADGRVTEPQAEAVSNTVALRLTRS